MRRFLLAACFCFGATVLAAQHFEVASLEDSYKGIVGEIIHAQLKIRNTSDKPVTLILKKIETQIGTSQRNYFCPDNNCLDTRSESYTIKLAPGETLENFSIGLEAGLSEGFSTIKYAVYNKSNPAEVSHLDLNFTVENKAEKSNIYQSAVITLHDVYPNPIITTAQINYEIRQEHLKAKIVIHNILGSALSVLELQPKLKTIKLDASLLNPGIYFYTLYINNEGVITRKLMVKK